MKKVLFSLMIVLLIASCKKDKEELTGKGSVTMHFDSRFGSDELVFGTDYVTQNGDSVNLSTFNYYVSNFVLVNENGTEYTVPQDECYHLVRHSDEATHELTLNNIPAGKYTAVKFIVGVDSAKSCTSASARTGDLDVVTNADMYWMWNSGYIFYKMEGTSPSAPLDTASGTRMFFYHIGGFGGYSSATINNIKNISLVAPEQILVGEGHAPEVHTFVDAREVFSSPNMLMIADHPGVMFSSFSTSIADNYQDMFSINHVHNE